MSKEKIYLPEIFDSEDNKISQDEERYYKKEKERVEVYSRRSPFVFINRWSAKGTDSYGEVIGAEENLAVALMAHKRAWERLENIDVLIKKDKIKDQRELNEEKLKKAEVDGELALVKKHQQVEEAKLDKELRDLKADQEAPKNHLEELQENLEKKYQEEKIRQEYKNKQAIDEIENKDNFQKELEKWEKNKKAQAAEKIGKGKPLADFNSEEMALYVKEMERIEDKYYKILDSRD